MALTKQEEYTYIYKDHSHPVEFLEAFRTFYLEGLFTDIILQCATGVTFQCHKAVLAACSNYFKAMFTSDMKEKSKNQIKLSGLSPTVLESLVFYTYTSEIQITKKNVQSLLEAADLLQFTSVKKACEQFLIRHLDIDNCLGMHSFAEYHVCPELEKESRRLLLSRFDDVWKQEEFLEISSEKLQFILSRRNLCIWKEEAAIEPIIKWIAYDVDNRTEYIYELLRCFETALDEMYLRSALSLHKKCRLNESGYRKGAPAEEAELYDPLKKKWVPVANMIKGVGNATACVLKEVIYVTGGHYGYRGSCTYDKVQSYHSDINEWSIITTSPYPEYGLCSIALENELYLVGGQTTITDCYDPEQNVWKHKADMIERRMECGAVVMNGCIYVTGGYSSSKGSYLQNIEKYDPECNKWEIVGSLPSPIRSHGCVCVYNIQEENAPPGGRN
ncbi:kelch-like protein 23 isoform X4 [Varanus komodoensis]|uniref:kelch-like protein 23 isoform X4 n=1 Tax=Varanus komodoensis TaxID=61221 RepID=UPI001CF7EBFA|nr:kelch-like protein 23 isoform X4 [Varanus komodoensis]